jgi:hypothetical protein
MGVAASTGAGGGAAGVESGWESAAFAVAAPALRTLMRRLAPPARTLASAGFFTAADAAAAPATFAFFSPALLAAVLMFSCSPRRFLDGEVTPAIALLTMRWRVFSGTALAAVFAAPPTLALRLAPGLTPFTPAMYRLSTCLELFCFFVPVVSI